MAPRKPARDKTSPRTRASAGASGGSRRKAAAEPERATPKRPAAKPKRAAAKPPARPKRAAAKPPARPKRAAAKPPARPKRAVAGPRATPRTRPGQAEPSPVERYAEGLPSAVAALVRAAHDLLRTAAPGMRESLAGGVPCFEIAGPVCYLAVDDGALRFGFPRGAELDDPHGLLRADGARGRCVRVPRGRPLPEEQLIALVQQAVVLNLARGTP